MHKNSEMKSIKRYQINIYTHFEEQKFEQIQIKFYFSTLLNLFDQL